MMAAGFGTSFALTGTTTTVMAAAPDKYSGTASALFNTTRQIGSAAGVALGGTLLAATSQLHHRAADEHGRRRGGVPHGRRPRAPLHPTEGVR